MRLLICLLAAALCCGCSLTLTVNVLCNRTVSATGERSADASQTSEGGGEVDVTAPVPLLGETSQRTTQQGGASVTINVPPRGDLEEIPEATLP
jgi:hypothetical protein